ncbi:hypothetical protein Cni_G05304 [Canna indica]|uniref:Uncharacterized protein n=1 Tax=Canna indica TaxID=4628 RepID=A0AAQ3JUY1_9LILI|nr:hypothetical protein Cni_G05304 [Canna indica]
MSHSTTSSATSSLLLLLMLLLYLVSAALARPWIMFKAASPAVDGRADDWSPLLLQALPKGPVTRSGPSTCTHSTARSGGVRRCPLKLNRVGEKRKQIAPPPPPPPL